MKKIKFTLLMFIAFIGFSIGVNAQTCNQTFTASGLDDDPTVVSIIPSDITCNSGGAITGITIVNAAGSLTNANCGGWYTFDLIVDGTPIVTDGCAADINNSVIPTTFSSIVVSSNDIDVWSDGVTITFDLEVAYTPASCLPPVTLNASGITTTTADLSWAVGGTETLWNVEVGLLGFIPGTGAEVLADLGNTTMAFAATGLLASSNYQFYVQSDCGAGDLSVWAGPFAFSTTCGIFSTNFTEGFETAGAPPTCWTMAYANASPPAGNIMTHSTTQFYAGLRSFRFSSFSTGVPYNQYLITPELDFSTSKIISFQYRKSNTDTETFSVGTSTTGNDYTTDFTWSSDISDASNTAWTEFSMVIPAGTKYIAIQYKSVYMYYLYVDEFSVMDVPACVAPNFLTAANIGQTTVDLGWTENGTATTWNIEYGAAGFVQGSGTMITGSTTNPHNLTGLTMGTPYSFYVQSDCGGTQSTWSGPFNFTTTAPGYVCSDPIIVTLPVIDETGNTAGFGDDYDNTMSCGSNYMTGDDIVYEFTLTQDGFISGDITTTGSWPGMFIVDGCPDAGGTCVVTNTSTGTYASFIDEPISAGTYYVIISSWPTPQSIDFTYNLSFRAPSVETDILTYSFPEQTGAATIDAGAHTVAIEVGNGTVMTGLVATYTLSTGATAEIAATPQVSGTTPNDFSSALTYSIIAEDGTTNQNWVVTVTEAVVNTETDILTYTFPEATGAATIDDGAHTVAIEVNWMADVTNLIADFTLSYGANADIAGTPQVSTTTVNDFTNPVTYAITAEDGTTIQPWVVTVTQETTPVGMSCGDPIAYAINDAAYTNTLIAGTQYYFEVTLDQDYTNVQVMSCGSDFDTKIAYFASCTDVPDMSTCPASPVGSLGYDDDDACSGYGGSTLASNIAVGDLSAGTYIAVVYGYGTTYSGNIEFRVLGDVPAVPTLTWDATTFTEAIANDGSISTVVNLTLTDETFATVGALTATTDFNVANVPAGLTVAITTTSTTEANISLTGNAAAHENLNDVSDMEITFLDAAFDVAAAADVIGYTQTALVVDFEDAAPVVNIIINEVDADNPSTDDREFIELYDGGVGNSSLDGYVVVLFNGAADNSYNAIDLDGYSTDADGYFVIGNTNVANYDLDIFTTDGVQNGADAVALYMDDATSFPFATGITATNLVDLLVYDTSDADDTGLLAFLNVGQPQINEGGAGNSTLHSCSRLPNGSGGALNTDTYAPAVPTPGAVNMPIPVLTWDATTFAEDFANDGSISTIVNLSLVGETFATIGTLVSGADFSVANVPAGLTVAIVTSDANNASIALTGNALAHANLDDIANMEITFLDPAFSTVTANLVAGYTNTALVVDFIDVAPAYLTWDGTTFNEGASNIGTIANNLSVTLTNDVFTVVGGALIEGTHYSVANVPAGLTVGIATTDANNATIALLGGATSHANADDISNLEITFSDAAFTSTAAAAVVDFSQTAIVVDFDDPAVLAWDATAFVEAIANDGSISTVVNLTLTGETFTSVGTFTATTEYNVANVPSGLTVEITTTSTTEATVTLTGNAAAHENVDDVANMEITFTDAAFVAISASNIIGYSQTALVVDFTDAVVLTTDLTIVFPESENYVCDFNGADTIPIVIMNIGETVILAGSTIDIFYQFTAGPLVSDAIVLAVDLNPTETVMDMFDAEEDLATPGTYNWTMWFTYVGEDITADNIITGFVESYDLAVDLGGVDDTLDVVSYPQTLDAGSFPYTPTYLWWDMSTDQTLVVNADGWYGVNVEDEYGCWAEDSVFVQLLDGVIDVQTSTSFNVYPNPNKGIFTFEVNTPQSGNMFIELMNVNGQVVYSREENAVSVLMDEIDIRSIADGVYYLKVRTQNENLVKKIVVQ